MSKFTFSKGCLYINIDDKIIEDFLNVLSKSTDDKHKGIYDRLNSLLEIPNNSLEQRKKRDGEKFHLTVLIPEELDKIKKDNGQDIEKILLNLTPIVNIFGMGINSNCYYLVCGCPEADNIRKNFNLQSMQYHITLGFESSDVHGIKKDIGTITKEHPDIISQLVKSFGIDNKKNLDMVEQLYLRYPDNDIILYNLGYYLGLTNNIDRALMISEQLMEKMNENYMGGCYIYLSIKSYQKLLNEKIIGDLVKNILSIKKFNWFENIPKSLTIINKYLLNSKDKKKKVLGYDKESMEIKLFAIPHNFSFVDGKIAGSAIVKEKHIEGLKALGFTCTINLMETIYDKNLIDKFKKNQIITHHIPIFDRHETTISVVKKIFEIIEKTPRTLVHCLGGVGRTNMILSCYYIKFLGFSPLEASTILNEKRKVLMTDVQMLFIKKIYGLVNNPDLSEKTFGCNLTDSTTKTTDSSTLTQGNLIMMIGCPCSGKTTLSLEFIKKYPDKIIHLNQDELGKKSCEEIFLTKIKGSNTIILDRCNGTKKERKEWLDCTNNKNKINIVGIYFDIGLEQCLERIDQRKHHPTLFGSGGKKIIEKMYKTIEKPELSEGFDKIYLIKTDKDIDKIRSDFGLFSKEVKTIEQKEPIDYNQIIKFPRTKHLINLGAMSRDDLLFSSKELEKFLSMELIVEEKVDGANLGIFLDKTTMKIMVQNRSHYVNSSYHEQFKSLDKWILTHSPELFEIFEKNEYILYGEWIFFKHSIHYTKIPDYFLLFDIYDRTANKFLPRNKVNEIISSTTISQVPVIAQGKFTLDQLKKYAKSQSNFYDGLVEGIYVRSIDSDQTTNRGKIVRSDFIAGNEHWTKNKYVQNGLS